MDTRFMTRDYVLSALFAAIAAVSALVSIPLGPVPFTLQTFAVLLAGLVLGWRLGSLSMAAYLAVGLVAPVYHGATSGVGVLFGPTGGYLFGFVLAAALAGFLVQRCSPKRLWSLVAVASAGLVPIYALGALWLAVSLRTTNLAVVLVGGVLQFLSLDILKAFLAAVVARALVGARLALPALAAAQSRGRAA